MTKQEFENRVKVNVTSEEYYNTIEPMYMASDYDKDEFCKAWEKLNRKRIREIKAARKENEQWLKEHRYTYQYPSKCWAVSAIKDASIIYNFSEIGKTEAMNLLKSLLYFESENTVKGGIYAKIY